MLTQAQVLEAVRGGRRSRCLDQRDYARLVDFFPAAELEAFGFKLKEGFAAEEHSTRAWTREAVVAQLKSDVEFGFEKALGQRGISAAFMYQVVLMWLWVLEEEELRGRFDEDGRNYAQYGLPLFKAVAERFGFDNPVGDDAGDEPKYAEGSER